ncbi:MAG TPA: hypothetical protein VFF88_07540 [Methylocella sp.]|nr:hypothetical protein [Methylocella sp.]
MGILIAFAILFSIYRYFERQSADSYFASQENLNFQEIVAVKNLRRQAAEEFVNGVIRCIHPSLSPGLLLTEQQVGEAVSAAIENYGVSNSSVNQNCQNKNAYWTFELPCTIKINKSPFGLREAVKLGGLTICKEFIAKSLHSALGSCNKALPPGSHAACLVNSIMQNSDLEAEIDKGVEVAR